VSPPYAAELRVYEPLSAFPLDERRRWRRYLDAGSSPSTREGPRLERAAGLLGACRPVPRLPSADETEAHAYVLTVDGAPLVCPWRTEQRCWAAAMELAAVLPAEVVTAALPAAEIEWAAHEHERWLAEHPEQRSHVLTSRWVVPVRWFLLVRPAERRLRLGGPVTAEAAPVESGPAEPSSGAGLAGTALPATEVGRSLLYRTAMADARRRVARALAVLRRAFDPGPVVGAVESLGRWLEEFHPRSVVELDYGGLVDLRSDAELRADDSAGELADALAALAAGDIQTATEAYERVIERWRIAHRVESAN
jgi:hypothetical protein